MCVVVCVCALSVCVLVFYICAIKLENSLLLKLLNLLASNSNNDSKFIKIEFERSIMDLLQEPRCLPFLDSLHCATPFSID